MKKNVPFAVYTLVRALLYGAMIAVLAYVGGAIPFPYNETIAALPVKVQMLLFFAAGFLLFFVCVLSVNQIRIKMGKSPLSAARKRKWF
ncbi:MAG: hypothetical protein IJH47_05615 [Oscillospiraceae bacterium]|nr:hypothetical protein [Oscillospiraceae bacterium]